MPDILAIETSSEACSVAVFVGGEIRERHVHAPLRHAELLLPAVSGLLDEAGRSLSSLDLIAFGRGPGSFTSLRIGIGVVQGLAWGAGLPVAPQSSLAALALDALERNAPGTAGGRAQRVRVAVDARMQEVFCGEYERDRQSLLLEVMAERVCAPQAAWPDSMSAEPFIAAGNGFERFPELATQAAAAAACYAELWPRAACIARLAERWLLAHEPLPPELAQPVYLRNDIAEKPGRG